ncbi:unnamed protein product [Lathyrus sativus]|nr:unnamed protein product [Lathyrus sativus]
MKPFSLLTPILLYLHLLFVFTSNLMWFGPNKVLAVTLGNQTDHLALLKFKESISSYPYGSLESWNTSIHFCKWYGITCSPLHQRVIKLNLTGNQLHGSLSPHVGNLSFLIYLNLNNNSFFGEISQELGQLLQLQQLHLADNSFTGEFPKNLTYCSNLNGLFLAGNSLIGKIPIEIGSLKKLQTFNFWKNNLTGGIPSSIGNLSFLTILVFDYNNLEGDIPQDICAFKNLTILTGAVNNLSGMVPSCLYNMSSLTALVTTKNFIYGSLPSNMFLTLSKLEHFLIGGNQFFGPIPTSIINASSFVEFDISQNQFVGQVPNLERLKDLQYLNLEYNHLGGNSTNDMEFLHSLANCTKLYMFSIFHNNFHGILPSAIGNLSIELNELYLGFNKISGQIPAKLGHLTGLTLLGLQFNYFEGMVPTTFGKFQKMQRLQLWIETCY